MVGMEPQTAGSGPLAPYGAISHVSYSCGAVNVSFEPKVLFGLRQP